MNYVPRIAAACATAALAGCVSAGTKVNTSQLAQFHKGITTEAQVEKTLGRPQSATVSSDGTSVLVYTYATGRPDAIDYVPIVGLFAGGATGKATSVVFTFDAQGRLMSYAASHSQQHVHTY